MSDFIGAAISATASHINGIGSWLAKQHDSAREFERQKEFAKNGIRWRVEDAKAAGIHPIYAIGANTPTYSPQAAVGTDFGLSQAGQDISRAIEAGQTRKERSNMDALQRALLLAQIDNVNAQTERIRGETIDDALRFAAHSANAVRTQQRTVPFPQSDEKVSVQPDQVIASPDSDPTHTAGTHPVFSFGAIGNRRLAGWEQQLGETLSEDVHMGLSAKLSYLAEWLNGNIKGPNTSQLSKREKNLVSQGWYWTFNPFLWSWKLNPPRGEVWGKIRR